MLERLAPLLVALSLSAAPDFAQGLFFVDDDAPGVFATIQDAIDAAPAESTILVRPGNYYGVGFTLNKAMQIVGVVEDGERPYLGGLVNIENVPSGQVVLRGFEIFSTGVGLRVAGCAGPVQIEDCFLPYITQIEACDRVLIARSELGSAFSSQDFAALTLVGSTVHAFDSTFTGYLPTSVTLVGTPGIQASASFLSLSGCSVKGGNGGFFGGCGNTAGGPGLALDASTCMRLDSEIAGGLGKEGLFSCPDAPDGPPILGTGVIDVPGAARSLRTSGPVREGDPLVLDLEGVAGEPVFALVAYDFDPVYAPILSGALAVPLSSVVVPLGVMPPGDALHLELPFLLGPGPLLNRLAMQIAHVDPSGFGAHFVGAPSAVVLLDQQVPLIDCDGNGVDDSVDALAGTHPDCDGDGVFDVCELYTGAASDCNGNGVPDTCDIASGASLDANGDGVPDECMTTWHVPTDFATIGAAVDAALSGDEIVIADGVYAGPGNKDIFAIDKSLTIRSANGPSACIVDCENDGWFLRLTGSQLEVDVVVAGLTIRRSDSDALSSTGLRTFEVEDCVFRSCRDPIMLPNSGQSSAVIRDSAFIDCNGAIDNDSAADILVDRCTFLGCEKGSGAGAIDMTRGHLTLRDSYLADCRGGQGGAVTVRTFALGAVVSGTTFRSCQADEGGAIWCDNTPLTVASSVFWDNTSVGAGSNVYLDDDTPLTISFTDLQGGPASIGSGEPLTMLTLGPGNLDVDPLFASANLSDPHLAPTSPCRDAGDPAFVAAPGQLDIDGEPRVGGAAIDMGADELHP